jgi:dipeptidyl aminopeptidase/acylaminoacyl peptidase
MSRRLAPVLVLAACSAHAPSPVTMSVPVPVAPPAASSAPTSDPTVLTASDRRRDQAREPLATAVVDAYANWNGFFSQLVATWSPDGKELLFGSTRDGLPEIYAADPAHPEAAPRAITTGPERALDAAYTRDGKYVLYTRDHEGDEMTAIWRVARDGSGATNLTPGEPLRRDPPVLPRGKPDLILYSAASIKDPSARLYQQAVSGGEPKLVYQQPVPGGLADVTADGARALMIAWRSNSDTEIDEVDVATGRSHRVYPPEGKHTQLYGAAYAPDGKRVLLGVDDGDKVALDAIDPASGKVLAQFHADDLPYAALGGLPSPKGDRVALSIDAGDHGEIRVLDGKTLKLVRRVNVPLGEVHLGAWRDDGKAFSILVSRPEAPPDVFAVDAATGAVTALRADPRPSIASLPTIDVSIQRVKAFDGLTIPINQYLPPHDAGAKLPSIVIFHGGPASSYPVRWSPYTRFFVSLGYAVLEPNVRGSTGFGHAYEEADNREKRADWLQDLETVNAWVKAQPWADPERVVVWGQSYGGYTTLMALTRQPTLWRAGVDLYGPADLHAFLLSTDAAIRAGFVAEFGDVDKDAALLDQFSPMRDVDKIVRPLFVYAGAHDPRVPLSEGNAIVKALRTRGVPVEYMVAADEGHSVDRRENKIELLTRTARFLEDALR